MDGQAHRGGPLRLLWRFILLFPQVVKMAFGAGRVAQALGSARADTSKTPDALTREVLQDMTKAGPESPTRAPDSGETQSHADSPPPPVDVQIFLERLAHREGEERKRVDENLAKFKKRESLLYSALLGAALLTLALGLITVGLVLAGAVPVAIASGALAIMPGAATLSLRRLSQDMHATLDELEKRRAQHVDRLDAISLTLSLPDSGERAKQTAELATRLSERAVELVPER
jgi:hypothetical protein